ncbi:MAG: hypothetical protein LC099_11335 [Anaerolineales bacterium]|nr:hypothetical protein [Anaerolineales bacterium]
MPKRRWINRFLLILLAIGNWTIVSAAAPRADVAPPPGPDRYSVVSVQYQSYKWELRQWKDRKLVCSLFVEHDGKPLLKEVAQNCDAAVYRTWASQPPCKQDDISTCKGYYAKQKGVEDKEKEIAVQLPAASARISIEGCEAVFSVATNICERKPTLVISGVEPLPNETIVKIEGTYGGQSFSCKDANVCKFKIPVTDDDGADVRFWAYSSYGDSSVAYDAKVRVKKIDAGDPDQLYWYVDVLSSQWAGEVRATCSETWGVFPPVGGAPEWLSSSVDSAELSSDIPYAYLAANLILQGIVDASACPDGGLSEGSVANQCGLEKSRDAVTEWQNQFDGLILETSQSVNVPSRLLKNLFARESQFWPGVFRSSNDIGLGQLTENGADTTLFWNPSFFNQFCPLVTDAEACALGYANLDASQQTYLRQALVASVNASCEDCPLGFDLSQANFSVGVFANTLLANCEQTAQVIYNYTGKAVSDAASYEDLWKFTLVNYNAGGGCLAEGVSGANGTNGLPLTWKTVAPHLIGACSGAVDYVNDISADSAP